LLKLLRKTKTSFCWVFTMGRNFLNKVLILLILLTSNILSQINVSGKISTTERVVQYAEITLINKNDTAEAYKIITDSTGNFQISIITSLRENKNEKPTKFEISQNYPNPFSQETNISYKINEPSNLDIKIYDILGQEVRRFNEGLQEVGTHKIIWDGTDNFRNKVSPGIYLYIITDKKESIAGKMIFGVSNSLSQLSPYKISSQINFHKANATLNKEKEFILRIGNIENTIPKIKEKVINSLVIKDDTLLNIQVDSARVIANAGKDQNIISRGYIILDPSESIAYEGDTIIYKWIADTNNPKLIFNEIEYPKVTVGFIKDGIYKYKLVVSNGIEESFPDEIIITVLANNKPVFEDPNLEVDVRYILKKPSEDLTDSILQKLDTLRHNYLTGESILSLKGIEKCLNLEYCSLAFQPIIDFSPLTNLTNLYYLDISRNEVFKNYWQLSLIHKLSSLDITHNEVSNVDFLKNIYELKYLNLRENPIIDISVLANLTKLEKLWISYAPISNFDTLGGLINLNHLSIEWCELQNISFLKNLTELNGLFLSKNNISDISSITELSKLEYLDISRNYIDDILALEKLENLFFIALFNNLIEDIYPLIENPGISKGDFLYIGGNPLNEISINEYIPILLKRGVIIL